MIGKILNDRYKILKKLGKGGMAVVYEAEDLILDRKVAIKMLRSEHVSDKSFIKKFHHEAKAVARLSHSNIVSIFDIGQDGELHYLVMENIRGDNLKDIINKRGKLSLVEALDITNQILSALQVAHQNDIIHCDIKPHNILITPDKDVKVTDFGIAKAVSATTTMTDTIMGSAHYFSPEQAKGGEIKSHSDLYSVGIVLYEMVTGEVPFNADSPISVALKHINEDPKSPIEINSKISDKLNNLIMKSLSKDPKNRFDNAEEMNESVLSILQKLRNKEDSDSTIVLSDVGDTKILKKSKLTDKNSQNKQEKNNKISEESRKKKNNNYTKNYVNSNVSEKTDNEMSNSKKWIFWTGITISTIVILGLIFFFIYNSYMEVPVVQVPKLEGLSREQAESAAAQVGLNIAKPVEKIYHPEVPENNVISQTPSAGKMIRQTREVSVTISKGTAEISLPDLTGETIREAEVILDNNDLKIGEKEFIYHKKIPEDTIIEQNPKPGTQIKVEDKIKLIISKGIKPNMVKMPNFIGESLTNTENKIELIGLKIGNIEHKKSTRFKENQIISQSHQSGKNIPENTRINLVVSDGLINSNAYETHSINVNITVRSSEKVNVRIVVEDINGEDVVYTQEHNPGDYISKSINSVGKTDVKVYFDNKLRHSKTIGG